MHAVQYAEIVRDHAARRRLIAAASEVVKLAWDHDREVVDAQATAEAAVLHARRNGHHRDSEARIVAGTLYDQVNDWQDNPIQPWEVRGIRTGITMLDKALGGLQSGVYLVAGRTSMGKTALILQMAEAMVTRGLRVLLFVLEMSAEQTLGRMVAGLAGG